MPNWKYTLKLKDIWKNEEMPLAEKRVEIVKRIKTMPYWKGEDTDEPLYEIMDGLETDFPPDDPNNVDDFNYWWNEFYDWADAERVWVEIF